MGYVSSLSMRMQKFPINHVVSGPHLFRSYDHGVMRTILEALVPTNALMMLASKAFEGDALAPLREQWYDTPYGIEALSDEQIAKWSAPTVSSELHLPQPNEFIATDFSLLPKVAGEDELTPPALIEDSAVSKIWYKQDSTFGQPRLSVISKIVSPVAYTSPRAAVLTELFRLLVKVSFIYRYILNEFC